MVLHLAESKRAWARAKPLPDYPHLPPPRDAADANPDAAACVHVSGLPPSTCHPSRRPRVTPPAVHVAGLGYFDDGEILSQIPVPQTFCARSHGFLITLIATVAVFESAMPSLALNVKLSFPE